MTAQDARTLLGYHYWARDRVLAAIRPLSAEQYARDLGSSFPSLRDTLVHLYSSEWIWHQRWQGNSPTARIASSEFPDVPGLEAAWTVIEGQIRGLIAGLGDHGLQRAIDYTLLSGQPGRSTFGQMLQHLVNHGSYHRGQITTMLRQVGAKPPESLDLITYYRV